MPDDREPEERDEPETNADAPDDAAPEESSEVDEIADDGADDGEAAPDETASDEAASDEAVDEDAEAEDTEAELGEVEQDEDEQGEPDADLDESDDELPEPEVEPEPESDYAEEPTVADDEPEETDESLTGRQRLINALRTPRRTQVVAGILLAVVGFAAITQVQTTDADSAYAGTREQDLIDLLSGLAGATERTQSELEELQATKEELENNTSRRNAALEQAENQEEILSVLAGRVPVKGPGLEITIDGYVQVSDFLDLIEELRTNGAEAIDVNGEVRLVADSYVSSTDSGLEIDGHQVSSPYVVSAIGNPGALKTAITVYGGPGTQLEQDDNAEVTSRDVSSMEIRTVTE